MREDFCELWIAGKFGRRLNGRTFISDELKKFLKRNGITHKFTHKPSMSRQVERYVGFLKTALKKLNDPKNVDVDI